MVSGVAFGKPVGRRSAAPESGTTFRCRNLGNSMAPSGPQNIHRGCAGAASLAFLPRAMFPSLFDSALGYLSSRMR
jgi:hypothetical protein